ncbi:hypothetical protein DFH08DRAFT_822042 [Mycena albidolilacea]|uniref:Uncharacterized protein n=1 Tax=Mycena albidolilacea TaxID=1033008 RepID=A0AAD6Z9P2_9AGAR|nr:hypothetical protein DFH08DRAFT_822042 [Mycena albidolilacea]
MEQYRSGSRLVLSKVIISGTRSSSLMGLVIISRTEDLNNQYVHQRMMIPFKLCLLGFKAECENRLLENKASLKREGTLQVQVKSLRDTIQLDKKSSMKYARNLSKRNWDVMNGCFVALKLTGKSTNYAVGPWRELVSMVDALPSAQWGRLSLWLSQLKMSHETLWMKELWIIQMKDKEPEYQLECAGPKYEGIPVPAAEYEEPMNELEYAGLLYEPDSFSVPMEDILVNPIESATGLDDYNMEDIFPNFDPQVFDFGSTYDLLLLPAPPASSPPTTVVTEGMQSTWKHKTRELEVDVRNIIPESQGCARFRARVRVEGPE